MQLGLLRLKPRPTHLPSESRLKEGACRDNQGSFLRGRRGLVLIPRDPCAGVGCDMSRAEHITVRMDVGQLATRH